MSLNTTAGKGGVVHHEVIPWRLMRTISIFMIILAVIHAGASLWIAFRGPLPVFDSPLWYYAIKTVFYAGIGFLLHQFAALEINITAEAVSVSFGRFRQRITFDEITDCQRDTGKPLLSYGGWGIRYRYIHGVMRKVYNVPGKPVIVLAYNRDGVSEFGFSTSFPDNVSGLISLKNPRV